MTKIYKMVFKVPISTIPIIFSVYDDSKWKKEKSMKECWLLLSGCQPFYENDSNLFLNTTVKPDLEYEKKKKKEKEKRTCVVPSVQPAWQGE